MQRREGGSTYRRAHRRDGEEEDEGARDGGRGVAERRGFGPGKGHGVADGLGWGGGDERGHEVPAN